MLLSLLYFIKCPRIKASRHLTSLVLEPLSLNISCCEILRGQTFKIVGGRGPYSVCPEPGTPGAKCSIAGIATRARSQGAVQPGPPPSPSRTTFRRVGLSTAQTWHSYKLDSREKETLGFLAMRRDETLRS